MAELRAAFAEFVAPAERGRPADGSLASSRGQASSASTPTPRAGAARARRPRPPQPAQRPRRARRRSSSAGFDVDAAAAALADFPGVQRRLELKGERGGARIYDDYAHHPTEVRAALSALRELEPERLIAVFQPHLYSRTKAFAEEFGAALALADEVVVLDVYPAREEPVGELAGVSGLQVAQAAADADGRQAGLVAADALASRRRAALEHRGSAPADDPGHDRRRRRLQARRGAGRGGGLR